MLIPWVRMHSENANGPALFAEADAEEFCGAPATPGLDGLLEQATANTAAAASATASDPVRCALIPHLRAGTADVSDMTFSPNRGGQPAAVNRPLINSYLSPGDTVVTKSRGSPGGIGGKLT